MPVKKKSLLTKFLVWRLKHIPNKQFIYIVSVIVGVLSGICAVTIKNFTHFIQLLLEGKLVEQYHAAFYFIFPILGFMVVYIFIIMLEESFIKLMEKILSLVNYNMY